MELSEGPESECVHSDRIENTLSRSVKRKFPLLVSNTRRAFRGSKTRDGVETNNKYQLPLCRKQVTMCTECLRNICRLCTSEWRGEVVFSGLLNDSLGCRPTFIAQGLWVPKNLVLQAIAHGCSKVRRKPCSRNRHPGISDLTSLQTGPNLRRLK